MAPAFHTISVEAVSQVEEKLARDCNELADLQKAIFFLARPLWLCKSGGNAGEQFSCLPELGVAAALLLPGYVQVMFCK